MKNIDDPSGNGYRVNNYCSILTSGEKSSLTPAILVNSGNMGTYL